jgi:hypothetical protein
MLDATDALVDGIDARVLTQHIAQQVGDVALQCRKAQLDVTDVFLHLGDIRAHGPQVFKDQIFDLLDHGGIRSQNRQAVDRPFG